MTRRDAQRLYLRETARVEEWGPGRTPADGPPDEVIERVSYIDVETGEIVTDPATIARIERSLSDATPDHRARHAE